MAKYAMLFVGGTVPEDKRDKNMKDWMEWLEKLDSSGKLSDPGGPFGESKVVSQSGIKDYGWQKDSNVGGYLVVEASSAREAAELTKGCPGLMPEYGDGVVEVREIMSM